MNQTINYRLIAPCIFTIIIDALGFGLVYPVMTALLTSTVHNPIFGLTTSLQMKEFYLGLSFMLYPLCMFFGTSFMADLSDKLGRKKVLLICTIGISISFFAMALGVEFSSIALLLAGRAFSGLMAGSQPVAQAAIADLSTPDTLATNMSIISLSYCIGCIIGPFLGGFTSDPTLVSWFNFSTPFFIAAILSFIAFAWILTSFTETSLTKLSRPLSLLRPIQIFIEAFHHKPIRTLTIIFLLMQIGFSLYFQFIIVQMKYDHHFLNWQLGALQGMIGLGFAIGLLIGMPFSLKRWKVIHIACITMMLTGIGQLFSASLHLPDAQWGLAVLIAAVDIMAFTSMLTLFSKAADREAQGWAMGVANSVMALSWAITGLCSNLLVVLKTHDLIFIGGISLVLAGWLLWYKSTHDI